MATVDGEQNLGKRGEQVSQTPLIECKYSQGDGDIFLFLTREGLKELISGKLLKTVHPQTGASFSLRFNPFPSDYSQQLDVVAANSKKEVFSIELSPAGYVRLTNLAYEDARAIGGNRLGAPDSRVNVVVDNGMVEQLAHFRATYKKPL